MAQIVSDDYYIYILRDSLEPNARKQAVTNKIFFSEIPEDVQILKNTNYSEEPILGRSEPWLVYHSTSATIVTFTGRFVAQGEVETPWYSGMLGYGLGMASRFYSPAAPFLGIGGNVASFLINGNGLGSLFGIEKDVQDKINIIFSEVHKPVAEIEALAHPQYNPQGVAYPPPLVRLRLGSTLDRTGIIRNVSIGFHGPWQKDTLLAYRAEAFITFQEVNATPKSWANVRSRSAPSAPPDEVLAPWRAAMGIADIGRSGMGL